MKQRWSAASQSWSSTVYRVKLTWMGGAKGNTHMKSLVIRWEPLAMDLNSTPSKFMSWGRHHSTMFPARRTQIQSWKCVPMWSFTLLNFLCKILHGSRESQTASDNKKWMTRVLDFSTDHFHTHPDFASWYVSAFYICSNIWALSLNATQIIRIILALGVGWATTYLLYT